jgi:hypothetical protein
MKPDKFSSIAREFHAREKATEEAARRTKQEDEEEEKFYDILGPALEKPNPCRVVHFLNPVPERLIKLVRKQDKLVLSYLSPCCGDSLFTYTIKRRSDVQ